MSSRKWRAALGAAILAAAIATGAAAGGAFSTTQAGISTSPGGSQAGFTTSPGTEYRAGVSSSPGRTHLALRGRKAGKEQQEYLLAIPGVRGTGGGA